MSDLAAQKQAHQRQLAARHPLTPGAQNLVKMATWVPILVLGLLAFLFSYLALAWLSGSTEPAELAASIVGAQGEKAARLQQPENQNVVGVAIIVWGLSLSSTIFALVLSFLLLKSYAAGRIFNLRQADRLRRIGWMMVLAAPLMIIGKSINYFLIHRAVETGSHSISIGIEHSDLMMLAFGLLIVVVGHVMRTALAIAEENENFV